ncbi:MAG: hypothetical protein HOQ24_01990 [Mycobacteriaceae bacterium]|nr:hypothetical protein [Mycobacteriaceae bacterium]
MTLNMDSPDVVINAAIKVTNSVVAETNRMETAAAKFVVDSKPHSELDRAADRVRGWMQRACVRSARCTADSGRAVLQEAIAGASDLTWRDVDAGRAIEYSTQV